MASERYLNHPTFGMLYRVAPAGEGRDVYAEVNISRCRRDGSDDLVSWRQLFDQTFI